MIITIDELQKLALKTINQELNPNTREILNKMSYTNPEFEQGFVQGMVWLSLLAVLCSAKKSVKQEDDSQRVIAALEGEGFYNFNPEEEKAYNESINKLYKPIGKNIEEHKSGNSEKKEIVKKIKWVEDRIGDDGVPKSISVEKNTDGTYEVWLIRAENEPGAIKKLKTCETLDEALAFVREHYIRVQD